MQQKAFVDVASAFPHRLGPGSHSLFCRKEESFLSPSGRGMVPPRLEAVMLTGPLVSADETDQVWQSGRCENLIGSPPAG
jgi:hypothetical protein